MTKPTPPVPPNKTRATLPPKKVRSVCLGVTLIGVRFVLPLPDECVRLVDPDTQMRRAGFLSGAGRYRLK